MLPMAAQRKISPLQNAAMSRTAQTRTGTALQGVTAPAANNRVAQAAATKAATPAAPATPAEPAIAENVYEQDPLIEQMGNDIMALNAQARGDIQQQGQQNFSSMQRAAMSAAGRLGGGVGGAMLSNQGNMLRQATKGMSDALAANSGQRTQIMGNMLDQRYRSAENTLGYNRDLAATGDAQEAEREGQTWNATVEASQAGFARAIENMGMGNPNAEGGITDPEAAELYNKLKTATTPEELEAAEKALQDRLNEAQREYEDKLIDALVNNPGSLSPQQAKQALKLMQERGLTDEQRQAAQDAKDKKDKEAGASRYFLNQ